MKLEYFYYMMEIAKVGSISGAADNLDLSQPYLSSEIKNLENKMGIPLLIRTSKGVLLTQAGEAFVECSESMRELIIKVKNISANLDIVKNQLSINSMYSFTFLDLYHNFSVEHNAEEDKVMYEEMPNELISEMVKNYSTNVGIIYLYSDTVEKAQKEFLDQGMKFVPLIEEGLSVVVNRNHPIAQSKSVDFDQLKQYKLVMEKQKTPNKTFPIKNNILSFMMKNCTLKQIFFDNNRSLLYYITKNDNCFTVGQKSHNETNPFVLKGDLIYIPIDDLQANLTTGYLINTNGECSRLQDEFIHYIEAYFQEYNKRVSTNISQ